MPTGGDIDTTRIAAHGLSSKSVERKEVTDAMERYFGPMGVVGDAKADSLLQNEILTLPEAYKGRVKWLMSKMESLIIDDSHWIFQAFPWEYSEDINVAWEILKFDRSPNDLEPELGVPRIIASSSETRQDQMVRRGQGAEFEWGFMFTPQVRFRIK